jgi:hypothetical protein
MTQLIVNHPDLLNNMLDTLDCFIDDIKKDLKNTDAYITILTILHDFKYLARPETI